MKVRFALLLLISMLVACTGIPLRSLPRLVKLQSELLEADPAEFIVAIQVDVRMVPPPGAVPVLQLTIRPSEPGAFEVVDRKLPMRFTIASTNVLGLATPPSNRRWLVYSLPPESQSELINIQNYFKRVRMQARDKGGGSFSMGIAQGGVATNDPALANTQWESWLQTSRREGFFEIWSGSIAELLKHAKPDKTAGTPRLS